MGAATFAYISNRVTNDKREILGTLTLGTPYVTNGDSFAIATQGAGLNRIDSVSVMTDAVNNTGYSLVLGGTAAAPLFKVFETPGTEVLAGTNLSTIKFTVRLIGS